MPNRPFKQLLSSKNFLFLWASQILSQLTLNLINFSIFTHIYGQTQSTIAVSLLWVSYSLPAFLFGPFTGSLVDLFSRKKLMVTANLLQAATVALYLLAGEKIFYLYSLAFLYSAFDQFYLPSQQASIPNIVPKHLYSAANGIFLLTQQASFLVGFGLGGVFLSLLGRPLTIISASTFLLLAAYFASRLPKEFPAIETHTESSGLERFASDVAEGYRLLKNHPVIKIPVSLIILLQAYITIIAIILPSYASTTLHLNLYHAGPIIIIPAAIGALLTTMTIPKILRRYRKKVIIENGLLTAALSIFTLSLVGYLPSTLMIVVVCLSSFGLGAAFAAALIPANTLLQEETPEEFRGRVFGVLLFFMTIFTAIPLILVSSLTDLLGIQLIMAGLALILLFTYLLSYHKGNYVLANRFGI